MPKAARNAISPSAPMENWRVPPEVHFRKRFRYAYQSEYRFVSFPAQPTDRLTAPLTFSLGSLADIGRLIVL